MKKHVAAGRFSVPTALLVLALACHAALVPVHALEVAGVNYQTESQVKGNTLQLNGAGVRQQADAPLYTAGLYLEKKASTAQQALASSGAKQVRVVMLREVNSRDFAALLSRGLIDNSSDEDLSKIVPEIMDLGTLIAQSGKLQAGDSFVIDWSATQGTTIQVNQRANRKPAVEVFAKPDVIGALMRIWLGEHPADTDLKAALLGKSV